MFTLESMNYDFQCGDFRQRLWTMEPAVYHRHNAEPCLPCYYVPDNAVPCPFYAVPCSFYTVPCPSLLLSVRSCGAMLDCWSLLCPAVDAVQRSLSVNAVHCPSMLCPARQWCSLPLLCCALPLLYCTLPIFAALCPQLLCHVGFYCALP